MSDPILDGITRWKGRKEVDEMYRDEIGPWVLFSDLPALLEQARTEGAIAGVTEMAAIRPPADDWREAVGKAYEQGQRDEREACAKRVEVWAARSAYGLKAWDGLFAAIKGDSDE